MRQLSKEFLAFKDRSDKSAAIAATERGGVYSGGLPTNEDGTPVIVALTIAQQGRQSRGSAPQVVSLSEDARVAVLTNPALLNAIAGAQILANTPVELTIVGTEGVVVQETKKPDTHTHLANLRKLAIVAGKWNDNDDLECSDFLEHLRATERKMREAANAAVVAANAALEPVKQSAKAKATV